MTEAPRNTDRNDQGKLRKRGRPVQMCQAEREALVLDCAIALLSEMGPEDVTMDDIAQRYHPAFVALAATLAQQASETP